MCQCLTSVLLHCSLRAAAAQLQMLDWSKKGQTRNERDKRQAEFYWK
jgi:hypothetical protein